MIVNGKEMILQKEIPVREFLEKEGYDIQKIAVEKNGEIRPKIKYGTERLFNTDKIEIVCFVGGG